MIRWCISGFIFQGIFLIRLDHSQPLLQLFLNKCQVLIFSWVRWSQACLKLGKSIHLRSLLLLWSWTIDAESIRFFSSYSLLTWVILPQGCRQNSWQQQNSSPHPKGLKVHHSASRNYDNMYLYFQHMEVVPLKTCVVSALTSVIFCYTVYFKHS